MRRFGKKLYICSQESIKRQRYGNCYTIRYRLAQCQQQVEASCRRFRHRRWCRRYLLRCVCRHRHRRSPRTQRQTVGWRTRLDRLLHHPRWCGPRLHLPCACTLLATVSKKSGNRWWLPLLIREISVIRGRKLSVVQKSGSNVSTVSPLAESTVKRPLAITSIPIMKSGTR